MDDTTKNASELQEEATQRLEMVTNDLAELGSVDGDREISADWCQDRQTAERLDTVFVTVESSFTVPTSELDSAQRQVRSRWSEAGLTVSEEGSGLASPTIVATGGGWRQVASFLREDAGSVVGTILIESPCGIGKPS